MASEVRVNTITNRSGLSTVTFGAYGVEFVGITTVEQLNLGSAVTNINATGVSTFSGNIDLNADLDVDGHTELDGVNIAGVLTATSANFSGNVTVLGDLTYENVTNQDSIGIATARSGLRITGGGLDVVGVSTFNDNINLGDNDVLNFGASQDLKIYHSGTNSFIRDSGTGSLYVEGTDLTLRAGDSTTRYLVGNQTPGDVSLYYGNSKKFETASSGINVVGTTTTGQLSVTGVSTFSGNVNLGDNDVLNFGASDDLKIYHNASSSFIDNQTNHLYIRNNANDSDIYIQTDDGSGSLTNYIICDGSNGEVTLRHYGTQKLKTTFGGIDVTGTTTTDRLVVEDDNSGSPSVVIKTDDGNPYAFCVKNDTYSTTESVGFLGWQANDGDIFLDAEGNAEYREFHLRQHNGTTPRQLFYAAPDGAVALYHAGSTKLVTTSGGIDVTGSVTCDGLTSDGYATFNSGGEFNNGDVVLFGAIAGRQVRWDQSENALEFEDNTLLRLGASNDLQISHDGSNSYISHDNTGSLLIDQNRDDGATFIRSDNGSGALTNYFQANGADGSVYLYHYGSEKLKTLSTGINVTGEVQCDSLDVDGGVDITGNVNLHADLDLQDSDRILIGTGDDLQLYHDGTNSSINNYNGHFYISNYSDDQDITIRCDNGSGGITNYIICDGSDGSVRLYHYGTEKVQTTSSGINVTGTVTCDTALYVEGSTYGQIEVGGASGAFIDLKRPYSDDYDLRLITTGTGADINVNGNNLNLYGHFIPGSNNAYDLGTSSLRWRNVYTNDLNLSNEGSTNDVDGTWGNYTIQEGEDDLFLINRRSGKKYKFMLQEVN